MMRGLAARALGGGGGEGALQCDLQWRAASGPPAGEARGPMATGVAEQAAAPAGRQAASAGVPILAAKITPPSVPDWAVQRPRITELIAEGTCRCPVTAATGPPGAGKTMALALWAAAE